MKKNEELLGKWEISSLQKISMRTVTWDPFLTSKVLCRTAIESEKTSANLVLFYQELQRGEMEMCWKRASVYKAPLMRERILLRFSKREFFFDKTCLTKSFEHWMLVNPS